MKIDEKDAYGNILLGEIAKATANMVLEGYEYDDIMESLHDATETAINGIIEGKQEMMHKREG